MSDRVDHTQLSADKQTKNSDSTEQPFVLQRNAAMDAAIAAATTAPTAKQDPGILGLAVLGGKAALHAGIQSPLNAFTELVDRIPGIDVTAPTIFAAPKPAKFGSEAWVAQTIGSGAGMVLPFFFTERVTHKVFGTSLHPVAKSGFDGAAFGFVLTPSLDPNIDFWEQRRIAAGSGMLTFATQAGIARGLMTKAGYFENTLFAASRQGIATRLTSNAIGGGAAGFVSAESHSLLSGHGLASAEEVKESVASFVVTGLFLDAAHVGREKYVEYKTKKADAAKSDAARVLEDLKTNRMGISQTLPLIESRQIAGRNQVPGAEMPLLSARMFDPASLPEATKQLRVAELEPLPRIDKDITLAERNRVPAETSREIKSAAQNLEATIAKKLQEAIPDAAKEHQADFKNLLDGIVARRRHVTDGAEIITVIKSVEQLLEAPALQVPLTEIQRIGLAKQLLFEVGNPKFVDQLAEMCGPAAIQQIALHTSPGQQVKAVVDVLTTGKFTTGGDKPLVVDLSHETLSQVDHANGLQNVYSTTLQPDAVALATLERARQPNQPPVWDGVPSYASRLQQVINANIVSQTLVPEGQSAVFAYGKPDPLTGSDGGMLFHLDGPQQFQPVRTADGTVMNGPRIESRQIQPAFDRLTGSDSSKNNFVLLNTREPLTPGEGSRFLSWRELETQMLAGEKPFVIEVDGNHPLFNDGAKLASSTQPQRRHVIIAEPAHTADGALLLRFNEPLFNVYDTYGRRADFVGEQGLTARDIYDASLHPTSNRIEGARELPGIQNFGRVDNTVFRSRRPDSLEGMLSLKQEGITHIIDLIQNPVMSREVAGKTREQTWAETAGIQYESVKTGVKDFGMQDVLKVIERIDAIEHPTDGSPPGKVLVHCARGADRTGAVIAFRRLSQGWSPAEALAEMRQYRWSENMHYASRMGAMIKDPRVNGDFNPQPLEREARSVAGKRKVEFQDMPGDSKLAELFALKDQLAGRARASTNNQGSVLDVIESQLKQTGLDREGWQVFAAEAAADKVGADYFLVNTRTLDVHFLDATANQMKGKMDAETGVHKQVPEARAEGVIRFEHNYFDIGELDVSKTAAVDWAQDLGTQLQRLAHDRAYFNLKTTPIPDYIPSTAAETHQQIKRFHDWLDAQPESVYKDYARHLRETTMRHTAAEASKINSPDFASNAADFAPEAILNWALFKLAKRPMPTPQAPPVSKIRILGDNYDAGRNVIVLEATAGTANVDLAPVMDKGRATLIAALHNVSRASVQDAREQFSRAKTDTERRQAAENLLVARLSGLIDKRITDPAVRAKLGPFLIQEQGRIRQGAKENPRDRVGLISSDLLRIMSGRTEQDLLNPPKPPEPAQPPTAKKAAAKQPYAELSPIEKDLQLELANLGVHRGTAPEEVRVGLELLFLDMKDNLPPLQVAALEALAYDYSANQPNATQKVLHLLPILGP